MKKNIVILLLGLATCIALAVGVWVAVYLGKHRHDYGGWITDNDYHWRECKNEKCNEKLIEKSSHSDADNDGKCDICLIEHSHSFAQTVTEPTCVEKGYTQFTCSCGYHYKDEEKAASGHDYSEAVTVPTCTGKGFTSYTCNACGSGYNGNYVDALGHDFGADNLCTRCGYFKHEHEYEKTVIEPTCTESGYTLSNCKYCTVSFVSDRKDALGHNYENGQCTQCGDFTATEGLKYTLSTDGTYYVCTGIETVIDEDIFIPSVYKGKPVTEIGPRAFSMLQTVKKVVIQDGITTIGWGAFYECSNLISLSIPASVKILSDRMCCECLNLTTVTLVYGLEEIEFCAFAGCIRLKNLTLPDSVICIKENAFLSCSGLQSINIPDSVTSISDETFLGCSSLQSINIPDHVTSIGNEAFLGCSSLQSINIPDSVISLGEYVFRRCSGLESVKLPDKIKGVTRGMFDGCGLKSIVLPENISYIGEYAFRYCDLQSINLPNRLTYIGDYAFGSCIGLESITFPEAVTHIGTGAFESCSGLQNIVIPEGVTAIRKYTFSNCTSLVSVKITGVVTEIGERAFGGCTNLKLIDIADLEKWFEISFETAANPLSTGVDLYLNGEPVSEVTFKDGITAINMRVFTGCTSLKSITIPDSVTEIGDFAFNFCSNLSVVNYKGTKEQWNKIKKGLWWDNGTDNLIIHCTDGNIQ
ncbi:MAG: leucine-rich repeat domain-containing protein [Clostridia bacterium]|nr:leucine-rich repeat domain-containing protein [Clostridia bacterium]